MLAKTRKQIIAAAVSASMAAAAMISPFGSVPSESKLSSVTPIVADAAGNITIDDMPSEYEYAADWIWENRISNENSLGMDNNRWNNLFDQIIAGDGTLNYVVRWQSYKDLTLDTRQKFQSLVYDTVNEWNDWLAGYENWPYDEVDVNIVGYTLIDEADFIDPQPGEVVWAGEQYLTPYDSSVDTSNGREEIPTVLPSAPDEYWTFNYFYDRNHVYPEIQFDMYLWCTQGFPDFGGCGGDWGQRFAEDVYIEMTNTRSNVSLQLHELGHAFGMTDFYGGEGASDGYPPGGFPGGNSIMWVNSSDFAISDFDGWMLRYIWTQIKDEEGRFDIPDEPVVTTTTTAAEATVETTTTTTAVTDEITYDAVSANVEGAYWADITFSGSPYAGINGVIGYMLDGEWTESAYEGTLDENGQFTYTFYVPDNVTDIQAMIYWSGVWDNTLATTVKTAAEITNIDVITSVVTTAVTGESEETTTTTTAGGTVEAEITETENYWSFQANGAKWAEIIFSAAPYTGANGGFGYWDGEWLQSAWEGTFDENGELVINLTLPESIGEVQVQSYWSQVWDNSVGDMVDTEVDLAKVILHYEDEETTTTTTTVTTTVTEPETTTTTTVTTTTATVPPVEETTTTTTEVITPDIVYGDADGNGVVELNDAVLIMCNVTDGENYPLTEAQASAADVYQRGDGVGNMDALAVQKYLAQLISALPESWM